MKYSILVLFLVAILLPQNESAGVQETVYQVISEQLGIAVTDITLEEKIANLGADGPDIVGIFLNIEDKLQIAIPEEDEKGFVTVNDVVQYIKTNFPNLM
ncbi:acyl carrier protein-like [Bradysia coprophila]|uniref:acyl carrier protein-like n=1 Tax=Bradysia coprophila TaxID=38358 RepID=UPI00187DA5D6|nr:acyl carrier protein-like [Bradysia coprophila]